MKKPAWTTPLFLTVNNYVGKWPLVDRLMKFAAHYLLFVLIGILLYQWWNTEVFVHRIVLFAVLFATSLGFSYSIALVWHRPRPVQQLLGIKILIRTLGTWKSFPSDHTIGATLVAYGAYLSFSGWFLILFIALAVSVAISRIWVGVHYPRDIFGGLLVAVSVIYMFRVFLS